MRGFRLRGFDGLIYIALLAALIYVALTIATPPPDAPIPPETPDGPSLPGPAATDPEVYVSMPFAHESGSGTAFAVDEGVWMTARHVVDGCHQVALLGPGRRGYQAGAVRASARSDVAVLDVDFNREPLAMILHANELRMGARGYHIGFPRGVPGEATSRLMGRETLVTSGRYAAREPVLAWAETGRTRGLQGPLSGMSGGPTLDDQGRVVGVTVAESPRRGRIYTAAPASMRDALAVAGAAARLEADQGDFIDPARYQRDASRLRRRARVAQVLCFAG